MDDNLGCFHVLANVDSVAARKGGSFRGLRWGSCLTRRNGLSEETHTLTKQENCHVAHSLRLYGHWVSFWVVSAHHSDSQSFLVAWASLSHREDFWEVGKMYCLLPLVGWHVPHLLSAPPEFSRLVFYWQHLLLYWDLLLWDNSGKLLSLCLAKGGGFGQQLPKCAMNIRMHVSFWIISFVWIYAQKWDCWIIWQLYI